MVSTVGVIQALETGRESVSVGEEEGKRDVLPHKYRVQWWSAA